MFSKRKCSLVCNEKLSWVNIAHIDDNVASKRFSVGWSMSRGSEGHFEAPVGSGKLHISTSKTLKMVKISVDLYHVYIRYSHEK